MVDFGAPRPARSRLDEMKVRKAELVERLDDVSIKRHRIDLAAAVGNAVWRQSHADALSAPYFDRGSRDFHEQPRAVFD